MERKRKALVTGVEGTLGGAVAARMAKEFEVLGIDRGGSSRDTNLSEYHAVDLSDEGQAREKLSPLCKKWGETLDIAVMTVGGFAMGGFLTTSSRDLDDMVSLNFKTAYHAAQVVFAEMKKHNRGGELVFIGAKPAMRPEMGHEMMAYTLSKYLLTGWVRQLTEVGRAFNIRSTLLVPSIIDTPANREAMPSANPDDWVSPEDIAEVVYLLSQKSTRSWREVVIKLYNHAG